MSQDREKIIPIIGATLGTTRLLSILPSCLPHCLFVCLAVRLYVSCYTLPYQAISLTTEGLLGQTLETVLLSMCMWWQWPTYPRIRICCPPQFSCGHPSVHHSLCRERKGGRERDTQWLASKKLFWVSFYRTVPHSSTNDHLTLSSMNIKETNPSQCFIHLC